MGSFFSELLDFNYIVGISFIIGTEFILIMKCNCGGTIISIKFDRTPDKYKVGHENLRKTLRHWLEGYALKCTHS